jgi:hypothetical protein
MQDLKLGHCYGKTLEGSDIDEYFLHRTPIALEIRRIDKWNWIKLKSCTSKETISIMERQLTE